jgi:hypothetical protein
VDIAHTRLTTYIYISILLCILCVIFPHLFYCISLCPCFSNIGVFYEQRSSQGFYLGYPTQQIHVRDIVTIIVASYQESPGKGFVFVFSLIDSSDNKKKMNIYYTKLS